MKRYWGGVSGTTLPGGGAATGNGWRRQQSTALPKDLESGISAKKLISRQIITSAFNRNHLVLVVFHAFGGSIRVFRGDM